MKLTTAISAGLLFTVLMAIPAMTEEFTPKVVLSPAIYSAANRNLDLLGLLPGMTPVEVEDVLKRLNEGGVISRTGTFTMQEANASLSTSPHIAQISRLTLGEAGKDELVAFFSGTASGNRLLVAERDVRFSGELDTLMAALSAKYGEPSRSNKDHNQSINLWWAFRDGAQVPCGEMPDYCPSVPAGYDFTYQEPRSNFDYVIKAHIPKSVHYGFPYRFVVQVADHALMRQSAKADFETLREEFLKVAASTAPIPAPAL